MFNAEIKKILISALPFKYLDIHELDMLIAYCQILNFSSGDYLLYQGRMSKGMYIIIHGEALLRAKVLGKDALNLGLFSSGDFVGEVSLIEKELCPVSVIAHDRVECLLISSAYFDILGIFFPQAKYKISKAITEAVCSRIQGIHNQITTIMDKSHMASTALFAHIKKLFSKPELVDVEKNYFDLNKLQSADFFKALTKEEYDIFLKHTIVIRVPNDYILIDQGSDDSSYYIILHGAVQLSILNDHKFAKVSVLGPLEIFGNMSYINNNPSIVTYATCEHSILLKISAENLTNLKDNHINIWFKFFDAICKSFVALERSENKLFIRINSELYNR